MAKAVKGAAAFVGPKCGYCGSASRVKTGSPRWAKCENGHRLYTKKG